MSTFNIYKNLAWLNTLGQAEAESLFLTCSGSELWASRMAAARPFLLLGSLYETAEATWFALPPAERIAAFDAPAGQPQMAAFAGIATSRSNIGDDELAKAERLYREKFGFIFVVSRDGRNAEELLAICRARFGNSVETELQIAAEEHRKIIESRLNGVLEQ